jgi:PPOX class probable F420-dependent enzyme
MEPWQQALIDRCRTACLATVGPDGLPQLVPVCWVSISQGIVIPVDRKPKSSVRLARLRNIERDRRVSLLFDHYDEDWTQLAWVRIEGTASVIEPAAKLPEALTALRARYQQYAAMPLEDRPLILIEPGRVVGWRWYRD